MNAIALRFPLSLPLRKDFLDGVATYRSGLWKCYGWLLACIGCAFRVQEGKHSFYVNRASFVEKLTSGSRFASRVFSRSGSISRAVMEAVNPIIGKAIPYEKLRALFDEFRQADFLKTFRAAKEDAYAKRIVLDRLEMLKNRHLETLPYEATLLSQKLKPGDILFKKLHESNSHIVSTAQWLFRPLTFGIKEREAYKFTHAAIYIGDGKIAEAVPHFSGSEVRILPLDDPRFALDSDCKNTYLVARPHDETLGWEAAEIAAGIAEEAGPPDDQYPKETPFKYDKIQAARSIWHPSNFGPFARYRYLKQYIDDHRKQLPRDFLALKTFFCSYFVGYCYQTAESRRIMPKLLGANDGPPMGLTRLDTAVFRGLWARLRKIQVWGQMSKHVKMQFDAKRLTPQGLRNFMIRNPGQFQDMYRIASPQKRPAGVFDPLYWTRSTVG